VPADFMEDVQHAWETGERGDLRLFAHEARSFDWASEGLRAVARAQCSLQSIPGARETLEWLRELRPDDLEADLRLVTVYEQLSDLTRSSLAVQRAIASSGTDPTLRAQALALHGHFIKSRWRESLRGKSGDEARRAALCGPGLKEALQAYMDSFSLNLNATYPGLRALELLCIRNELAAAMPEVWADQFDSDTEAQEELAASGKQYSQVLGAIQLALKSGRSLLQRQLAPESEEESWQDVLEAELAFLTATRPKALAQRYRDALTGKPVSLFRSVDVRLRLFAQLEVRKEFAAVALEALTEISANEPALAEPVEPPVRVLLFSGHMIDEAGRAEPRFPPTRAAEDKARAMLQQAISSECALAGGKVIGVAGGACGGDILFHEVCAEQAIPTLVYLSLRPQLFCAKSVQHAGPDWVERYYRLCARTTPRVLAEEEELPAWLSGKPGYEIQQRSNLWMLYNALALHAKDLTLIALWDTKDGDGPGGTDDLVFQVRSRGYKLLRLPAEEIKLLVHEA